MDICEKVGCEKESISALSNTCDEHDVCIDCGIHRNKMIGWVWGTIKPGLQCQSCAKIDKKKTLAVAMVKFEAENLDRWAFQGNDKAKCPYCGTDHEVDSEDFGNSNFECEVCDNTFHMEIEFIPSISTSKID